VGNLWRSQDLTDAIISETQLPQPRAAPFRSTGGATTTTNC